MDVPPHQDVHRYGQQIKYRTHARDLGQQIARRSVPSGPCAEPLLEERVGRDGTTAPVKGHEITGGKITGNRNGEGEHEGVPIGGERLTRITDVGDARHVGGEDTHAHDPSGDGPTGRGELVGTAAAPEKRTAHEDDAQGDNQKNDEIDDVHMLSFITCSSTAWPPPPLRWHVRYTRRRRSPRRNDAKPAHRPP